MQFSAAVRSYKIYGQSRIKWSSAVGNGTVSRPIDHNLNFGQENWVCAPMEIQSHAQNYPTLTAYFPNSRDMKEFELVGGELDLGLCRHDKTVP